MCCGCSKNWYFYRFYLVWKINMYFEGDWSPLWRRRRRRRRCWINSLFWIFWSRILFLIGLSYRKQLELDQIFKFQFREQITLWFWSYLRLRVSLCRRWMKGQNWNFRDWFKWEGNEGLACVLRGGILWIICMLHPPHMKVNFTPHHALDVCFLPLIWRWTLHIWEGRNMHLMF